MLIGIRSRIRVSHLGMQRSVHTRCDATNIQINKDTSVEKAVRFAYESLGRDPGSAADDLVGARSMAVVIVFLPQNCEGV